MSKTYRFRFPDGFSYVIKSIENPRAAKESVLKDYGFWARRGRDPGKAIPLYWALDLHKQNYRFEECEDQEEGANRRVYGPRPPYVRRKISEGKKGIEPWNKGGEWNEAQRSKLSGRKRSPETRRKLAEASTGNVPWNRGIPRTDEEKKKMSEATNGKYKWMTDGVRDVCVSIDALIPPGWWRGRTKRTNFLEIW